MRTTDDAAGLDPALVSRIADVQWLVYRMYGVTSQLRSPSLSADDDAWDWYSPWLCHQLHYRWDEPQGQKVLSPTHARCETCKDRLVRRGGVRPATGECAAGFRLLAWPLRREGRCLGHLIFGPFAPRPVTDRDVERALDRGRAQDPAAMKWAGRQTPVLSGTAARTLARWLAATLPAVLDPPGDRGVGNGAARDEVYAPPIRLAADPPLLLLDVFGWSYTGRPQAFPQENRRNYWEIVFVDRGEVRVGTDAGEVVLGPGQICLIRPRQRADVRPGAGKPPAGMQLVFMGQLGVFADLAGRALTLNLSQRSLLREICEPILASDVFLRNTHVRLSLLHLLLSLLRRPAGPEPDGVAATGRLDRQRAWIEAARRYMEDRVDRRVTLAELAAHCGVRISTLANSFKQRTGVPPLQYHARRRIDRAREMLRSGRYSVARVAELLAFADPAHFSRAFKRATGTPPSAYLTFLVPPGRRDPPAPK